MLAYLLALSIVCSPASTKIEDAVKTYVVNTYPIENAEYQFDYRRINWNIIPSEFDSVRVFKIGKDSPLGNTVFTLGIFSEGKLLKAIPVSIGVSLLIDALVTTTPINVGDCIHSVMISKRTISGRGEFPLTDSTLFEGMQAKNYIPAGTIIFMSMVEPVPIISPGDQVEIIYESRAMKVTARGIARQKGGIGDIISVTNVESKKIIHAEIIDSLTVALK